MFDFAYFIIVHWTIRLPGDMIFPSLATPTDERSKKQLVKSLSRNIKYSYGRFKRFEVGNNGVHDLIISNCLRGSDLQGA